MTRVPNGYLSSSKKIVFCICLYFDPNRPRMDPNNTYVILRRKITLLEEKTPFFTSVSTISLAVG